MNTSQSLHRHLNGFPALGRLRVSQPSLGTYVETIQMISYTLKPKMVHRTPQDHFNSSTAYRLHMTYILITLLMT